MEKYRLYIERVHEANVLKRKDNKILHFMFSFFLYFSAYQLADPITNDGTSETTEEACDING